MTTDTKTALLNHAEMAVRTKGFDGFSYADLATAVGIRKASIHYHFPTKAVLSGALMDRYRANIERACSRIDAEHVLASQKLAALIALYRSALNDGETLCLCVAFTTSVESVTDEVRDKIVGFRDMMVNWIDSVFAQARQDASVEGVKHPRNEAHALLALLEGAHIAARAARRASVFDQALTTINSRIT